MPHIMVFQLPRTRQRPPFGVLQMVLLNAGNPVETAVSAKDPLLGVRELPASGEAR
jgi:hypothetical protein